MFLLVTHSGTCDFTGVNCPFFSVADFIEQQAFIARSLRPRWLLRTFVRLQLGESTANESSGWPLDTRCLPPLYRYCFSAYTLRQAPPPWATTHAVVQRDSCVPRDHLYHRPTPRPPIQSRVLGGTHHDPVHDVARPPATSLSLLTCSLRIRTVLQLAPTAICGSTPHDVCPCAAHRLIVARTTTHRIVRDLSLHAPRAPCTPKCTRC
ncbi:hypothetical protein DFH06DRAFT_655126 [Mycena polygramma]|nr:hypothetical protein DFH06DRAFT_655126 [Mycena polygramma]